MAKTITLKDPVTREPQYPITLASNVYDGNGNAIPTIYATKTELSNYANKESVDGVLLWQNGSPNSSFAYQTITTADTSQYRFIDIYYKPLYYNEPQTVLVHRYVVSSRIEIDMHLFASFANDGEHYTSTRQISRQSATSIMIGDAYKANGNTTKGSVDNTRCIPIAIYGIK